MHPGKALCDAQARLVEVGYRLITEQCSQLLIEIGQALRGLVHPGLQRGCGDLRADQVADQVAGALIGDVLEDDEVDTEGVQVGPVLCVSGHAAGETASFTSPQALQRRAFARCSITSSASFSGISKT